MDKLKSDKYFATVEKLIRAESSDEMIKTAIKKLLPNKDDYLSSVFAFLLALLFALLIGMSNNTRELALTTSETLLNIILAIFGCVFTVYSIIIAVSSDQFIKLLSGIDGKKDSTLVEQFSYFEYAILIYYIDLVITGIFILLLKCIPSNFMLFQDSNLNNGIAILGLLLFYGFSFRSLFELKSTIRNAIILFRLSIAEKNLKFIEEEQKLNDEKKEDNK